MASKFLTDLDNPLATSSILPIGLRPRRDSVGSFSTTSQVDREMLSQALDQIHSSASQSETLTTFNEFAVLPTSSSGIEGKGLTSDLQGGLTGLYSRLRASVGGVKDVVGLGGDAAADDASSTKSFKNPISSAPNSTAKTTILSGKHSGQHSATSLVKPELGWNDPNPLEPTSNNLNHVRKSFGSGHLDISKDVPLPSTVPQKPYQPAGGVKPAPVPLSQAITSSAVEPALVEVNVSAVKHIDNQGQGVAESRDGSAGTSLILSPPAETVPRSGGSLEKQKYIDDKNTYQEAHSSTDTPRPANIQVSAISPASNVSAERSGATDSDYKEPLPQKTHQTKNSRSDRRDTISNSRLESTTTPSPNSFGGLRPLEKPSSIIVSAHSDEKSLGKSRQPAEVLMGRRGALLVPETRKNGTSKAIGTQPNRGIPGFNMSRASSTDTTGTGSNYTPTNYRSSHDDASGDEAVNGLGKLPSKSPVSSRSDVDPRGMNVLSQIRSRILSKEYWMRDENAKDCFYCGDPFSTFRRKHHCRTCGQIFDHKCTLLVPGKPFGQSGSLRVCKPCEGIINGHDDSSEFSDDGSVYGSTLRPRHGSTGASDISPDRAFKSFRRGQPRDMEVASKVSADSAPTMAIPATRRVGEDSNRRSAILEFDADRRPVRPGSSRSQKSSSIPKSFTSGHKRHHSRHLFQRGFKGVSEESAPFHHKMDDDPHKGSRLPAFHSDNIIDPDLAAFLSDEESSGEEQVSIMAALHGGDGLARSPENDRNAMSNLLTSTRKLRSHIGDKSMSGITNPNSHVDNVSLSSVRLGNMSRLSKRRNLSITSNIHLRPSPRSHRFSTASPAMTSHLHESISSSAFEQLKQPDGGLRIIRSSSMKGVDAPAVELNNASIQHVRKLLCQLLQDSYVANTSSWEKALIPILLQATDDVNPDVQNGDDIDIRHYVKLKKIPGGRPGDTSYVSGLVFTKNLALKSMPRSISYPNILILTFPLEYARHQQHFMSLEPVIRQEREFLQNLVNRIAALRPQLLLVQRNVSGLALEFLEQANIATAYNVKRSVLEAISRCSQTRIISSIDKLAIKPAQAGKCASFYLRTYVHGGRKKTYMFLSGCPKELGCTIVLRGSDEPTLIKIKKITEFMIYVVYNLKLETCLMRDEFAFIPTYTGAGSISPDKELARQTANAARTDTTTSIDVLDWANKKPKNHSSGSFEPKENKSESEVLKNANAVTRQENDPAAGEPDDIQMPEDIPMPTFYTDMIEKHKDKILSASPFVKFMQPYLLMRSREQERRLVYLKRLCDQDTMEERTDEGEEKPQKFVLIKPEMIHETIQGTSRKVREVLHAVHAAEYDKALHNYRTQKKQWEAYISGNNFLFDPFAHQNIVVLYSVVCTATSVPCSGPDILALDFYNEHETDALFEADCTLGQYVEDLCIGANTVCTANGCERKMIEHHRQYVHGNGQLSVTVEQYPSKLRGLQDIILMWSTCRVCGQDTQVMPMSDSTWKYSFGKYLELSFWSSELHARAGVCPHDIHKDHLRYFGFKDVALRMQYDQISLLEIVVPRTKITWKVVNDLKFKNDVFSKAEDRINKFMVSVNARIKSIKVASVIPEKAEVSKIEIEKMLKRATEDHHELLQKLQEKYTNSKYFEIIPINRAIRAGQEKVVEWDNAFAEFDRNFFPSEKDIRRLATLQLKKIFLDREDSVTSLASSDEGARTSPGSDEGSIEKASSGDLTILSPQTRHMSSEKTQDMLTAVVEDQASSGHTSDRHKSAPPTSIPHFDPSIPQQPLSQQDSEDIRHLDLAVPSSFPEKIVELKSDAQPETRPVSPTALRDSVKTCLPNTSASTEPLGDGSTNRSLWNDTLPQNSIHNSGIPRLVEKNFRRATTNLPPTLSRAQSQPTQIQREDPSRRGSIQSSIYQGHSTNNLTRKGTDPSGNQSSELSIKASERKLPERLTLATAKSGINTHSLIPRSLASRRKESRVSTLAKHFEQLSREFERERLRERRQRAAKTKQARAYPTPMSKPIVEVYRNVRDAVEEREPSDEDLMESSLSTEHDDSPTILETMANKFAEQTPGDEFNAADATAEDTAAEDTAAEYTETDDNTHVESHNVSDAEGEGTKSEEEHSLADEIRTTLETQSLVSSSEERLELKLDLPKHEKSSLMKMLTNFWAERSASGWQPLEYPLIASDHIFADSDIIIREDEPSSLIAFALGSEDYKYKLQIIHEKNKDFKIKHNKAYVEDPMLDIGEQMRIERSLLQSTGTHLKYQFQEGSAKMLCKIFYAEQFDAVRRKCGVADRIVESLSRCLKWDSKGGKTKSVFLKTLDDRLVLKSLSQIETQAFLRFAPAYFQLMGEALFHELPSVIAKMLGFYQIIIKNPVTGVEFNWFLLVMENLFYDRSPTRIFDLKGSMRNRRIQSTGEQNEVLLDENMVEFIYESPLFAREHSKRLLRASVWNDTLFLSRQNVMDYSLMIAIDENRKELVIGIIDCIRTYTWDKKLESWMKDRGKNRPTVTSPKEYKNRFREAMGRYVLQAPNCWHQFHEQFETRPTRIDEGMASIEDDKQETELRVTEI